MGDRGVVDMVRADVDLDGVIVRVDRVVAEEMVAQVDELWGVGF